MVQSHTDVNNYYTGSARLKYVDMITLVSENNALKDVIISLISEHNSKDISEYTISKDKSLIKNN